MAGTIINNMVGQSGTLFCVNTEYASDVLYANEINDGRNSSENLEKAKRYVRQWIVKTRHSQVPANVVRDYKDIPTFDDNWVVENPEGEDWIDDNVAVVEKTAYVKSPDDPTVWIVTVTYEQAGSPLSEHWEVTWDEVTFEKVATKNALSEDPWLSKPIVNSAGDPFDPPVTIEDSYPQLIITRWESSYNVDNNQKFKHAINNAPVTIDGKIYEENTLKLQSYKGTRYVKGNLIYYRCTLVIDYRPETWVLKVMDAGYRQLNDDDPPKRVHIKDGLGHPVVQPVPLDTLGKPLGKGLTPLYLDFMPRKRANFSELYLDYSRYGIPGDEQEVVFGHPVNPDEGEA